MLNGKELGRAIEIAIERKISAGAIKSVADVARHFGVRAPSVYGWIRTGAISKNKLPELWRYFSDVVGPEHWGLTSWPATADTRDKAGPSFDQRPGAHLLPLAADEIGVILEYRSLGVDQKRWWLNSLKGLKDMLGKQEPRKPSPALTRKSRSRGAT